MKQSIFTISVFRSGLVYNAPGWEIIWEGSTFADMMIRLGTAKMENSRVRLDWRDEYV